MKYIVIMIEPGKLMIFLGVVLIVIGIGFHYRESIPFLKKIGSLPGDIKIEKDNVKIYFPVMTSIIASIVLSFLLYLFRK